MAEKYLAFLSYTRLDDQFYGQGITAFCELLQLGVQVATGDKTLSIFQDIEGIKIGQQFPDRIDEALGEAKFLIPLLTPLFFNSSWCRTELTKFLDREKAIGKTGLILPIYFISTPLLEPGGEGQQDCLAKEIATRQRFDWRDNLKLKADDPLLRAAVLELAQEIAQALNRIKKQEQPPPAANAPTTALKLAGEAIAQKAAPPDPVQPKTILWVDDRPNNNIYERRGFARYNFNVDLALSTSEALALLRERSYDAIISDMGRPADPRAGYTLLEELRKFDKRTPYFIYSRAPTPQQVQTLLSRSGAGWTSVGSELIQMVLAKVSPQLFLPESSRPTAGTSPISAS